MADSKFDLDPEALAWGRAKVEVFIEKMRRFEEQAKHDSTGSGRERERQWRVCGSIAQMVLIGGEGCVIALFDERLPQILPPLDPPVTPNRNAYNRQNQETK